MAVTALKKKVAIDYPQKNEKITSSVYSLRISAPSEDGEFVDVSIDDAPPQPCRRAAGYWWYDWSGYTSDVHRAVATLKSPNGDILAESARRFVVELGGGAIRPNGAGGAR